MLETFALYTCFLILSRSMHDNYEDGHPGALGKESLLKA